MTTYSRVNKLAGIALVAQEKLLVDPKADVSGELAEIHQLSRKPEGGWASPNDMPTPPEGPPA